MKNLPRLLTSFTCATLLVTGHAQQPDNAVDIKQFDSKLAKDTTPLANSGQVCLSYANVAEKILPSVVTIFSSGPVNVPTIDRIPPQLRPFFYRFFGGPEGDFGSDENDEPLQPRRRGSPTPPTEEDSTPHQERGIGSGIILTADGYIMTNNHVIADAKKIEVAVSSDSGATKTYTAELVKGDPLTDVAILKIDATGLRPATLADSNLVRVGDVVLAAGAPMELSRSITMGIVSAKGRSNQGIVGDNAPRGRGRMSQIPNQGYEDFIQTDASINPGNSGGPLVDGLGRVVGMSTAILSKSGMNAGIGFAIPINMAVHIVEDLLDDGQVQRGFLGIEIRDLSEALAKNYGVNDATGALITYVSPDSPAQKAGIRVEDIVIQINGQRVDDSSRLRLIVSSMKPGTSIPVVVLRDNKPVTLNATLEALPEAALSEISPGSRNTPRKAPGANSDAELVRGVIVQNLSPALRERYDIPKDVTGIIVAKLDPASKAAGKGLEEGDVITHINRKVVTSAAEAQTLAKASGDTTILLRLVRKGDTMLLMLDNN